jgi:dGTPase
VAADDRPGYGPAEVERWVEEPAKMASRTPFARDRARVLHAVSLRRLGAKTQIHSPGQDDFVRSRLTHSLEVAQVGRELGAALGCDPDVVDTACLAHDLGHPPFGHNGERALNAATVDIGGFEGNAQTLRILTRLEAKSFAPNGRSVGLNLTRATLDAATKYPWLRGSPPDGAHAGSSKYGVYDDDAEVFTWLRTGAPDGVRCLEAQVMDFADDVAYSVHDVEDAVATERLDLGRLADPGIQRLVFAKARDWYDPGLDDAQLREAIDRLRCFPYWLGNTPFGGGRRQLAALKDMTSQLIGRFCLAAQQETRAANGDDRLTRYSADLVVPAETHSEIVVLKSVAAHFVMDTEERRAAQQAERDLLTDLMSRLAQTPQLLEPVFAGDYADAPSDADRLRVVADQVASLTDNSARGLSLRLNPQSGTSVPATS